MSSVIESYCFNILNYPQNLYIVGDFKAIDNEYFPVAVSIASVDNSAIWWQYLTSHGEDATLQIPSNLANCVKTWRYSQNLKYIMYWIAVRGLSHGHR